MSDKPQADELRAAVAWFDAALTDPPPVISPALARLFQAQGVAIPARWIVAAPLPLKPAGAMVYSVDKGASALPHLVATNQTNPVMAPRK